LPSGSSCTGAASASGRAAGAASGDVADAVGAADGAASGAVVGLAVGDGAGEGRVHAEQRASAMHAVRAERGGLTGRVYRLGRSKGELAVPLARDACRLRLRSSRFA